MIKYKLLFLYKIEIICNSTLTAYNSDEGRPLSFTIPKNITTGYLSLLVSILVLTMRNPTQLL